MTQKTNEGRVNTQFSVLAFLLCLSVSQGKMTVWGLAGTAVQRPFSYSNICLCWAHDLHL